MPVQLNLAPRDLQQIAKTVVANPTIGKKIRHSSFLSPHRRAVQSKGAFASYAMGGLQKGVSIALGQIPVPVVGSLLDKAWTAANEKVRSKLHRNHMNAVNSEEKVKFRLKELGSEVADWDRYRWKISHAVEQFNQASADVQRGISSAPCDTWVRVWAKYEYLASRIAKLRVSVEAMRGTLDACDEWLDSVEQSCASKEPQIKSMYDKDVAQLRRMQVHDTCADTKCMFKRGQWTSKSTVPTSSMADFFIKATSTTLDIIADDPIGDAVDAATS